jgi:hypothetical protein
MRSSQYCICGGTLLQWKVLNTICASPESFHSKIPSFLCESCCRYIFSNPLQSDGIYTLTGHCIIPSHTISQFPFTFHNIFHNADVSPIVVMKYKFGAITKSDLLSWSGATSYVHSELRRMEAASLQSKERQDLFTSKR